MEILVEMGKQQDFMLPVVVEVLEVLVEYLQALGLVVSVVLVLQFLGLNII